MSSSQHFLHSFFYPKSVAIVGASRNPGSVNFDLVANLVELKFNGKIYPVNPNTEEILGLKTYPDLKSIEGEVDLVVVAVPAAAAPAIVRDCVNKKVKMVALIPGGFSETGAAGTRVQDEMRQVLKGTGIRATGPNALSPINTANNLIISFARRQKLQRGKLSFIFQSGLYEPRFDWLFSSFHLRLSKLIDLGNKMDVTEVDALEYLAQDPETEVIALHLESIAGETRKFMQVLRDVTPKKPVIVLKTGRTDAGRKMAASHTGAIIKSSDIVVDAALKQSGAIRAQGLDEFFDLAKIFEYLSPLKTVPGNRIAVATFPGGEAVITVDFCQLYGFNLAELSPPTYDRLRAVFPAWEITVNPFDMGICNQIYGPDRVYEVLLPALAEEPDVDCLAIQVGSIGGNRQADPERLPRLFDGMISRGKPVVTWDGDPVGGREEIECLEANRIPVYPSAERAIRALALFYQYHRRKAARV